MKQALHTIEPNSSVNHAFTRTESNQTFFGSRENVHFFSRPGQSFVSRSESNMIQAAPDDKHDLTATKLSGDPVLEKTFDNETVVSRFVNSKGNHVKLLQDALIQLGMSLPVSGADTKFGKETADAVTDFQNKAGMSKSEQDGIVGRKTLGLLDRSLRSNVISPDTDTSADDLKVNDKKQQEKDEKCKGKTTEIACPVPNTDVNKGADDAIALIDKVFKEQLPPSKTDKADYPAIFSRIFRNNDSRPLNETVDEVKVNFKLINDFIKNLKTDPSHVRCGTECDGGCRSGSPAYHSPAGGKHIITFCPDFSKSPERTLIVIHECHHASVDKSRDLAYAHTRLIDKLDHAEALRNAASFHLYSALVQDPGSDHIGPKVKDTGSISDPLKQKKVDQAIAFMEQWFKLITFDMSRIAQNMDEAGQKGKYPEKSRTDLINRIYVKWFNVTPAPAKPKAVDIQKAKAIEERANKMEDAFKNVLAISESTGGSEWVRGPGKEIRLDKQLLDLDINHLVIGILQELVHATPDISAESEPLYVGTINDLRNDRELAP
jgi:hypothetical protein